MSCAASDARDRTPANADSGGTSSTLADRAVEGAKEAYATFAEPEATPPDDGITTVGVPIEGTDHVRGRSSAVVEVPIQKVRDTVLAFAEYPDFMPHYEKCKVLGRTTTGARDVYMEIAALHGAVKFWTRVEVPKPTTVDGYETYDARYVEGNVKDFRAIWRLKKVTDTSTEVSLEIYLEPNLPMPTSILNEENLDGSAKAIRAVRRRLEGEPVDG
jgi:ribosome-associated toxin RatA of RatAB toxin-antitoxin module